MPSRTSPLEVAKPQQGQLENYPSRITLFEQPQKQTEPETQTQTPTQPTELLLTQPRGYIIVPRGTAILDTKERLKLAVSTHPSRTAPLETSKAEQPMLVTPAQKTAYEQQIIQEYKKQGLTEEQIKQLQPEIEKYVYQKSFQEFITASTVQAGVAAAIVAPEIALAGAVAGGTSQTVYTGIMEQRLPTLEETVRAAGLSAAAGAAVSALPLPVPEFLTHPGIEGVAARTLTGAVVSSGVSAGYKAATGGSPEEIVKSAAAGAAAGAVGSLTGEAVYRSIMWLKQEFGGVPAHKIAGAEQFEEVKVDVQEETAAQVRETTFKLEETRIPKELDEILRYMTPEEIRLAGEETAYFKAGGDVYKTSGQAEVSIQGETAEWMIRQIQKLPANITKADFTETTVAGNVGYVGVSKDYLAAADRSLTGVMITGKIDPQVYLRFIQNVPPEIAESWLTQMGGLTPPQLATFETPISVVLRSPVVPAAAPNITVPFTPPIITPETETPKFQLQPQPEKVKLPINLEQAVKASKFRFENWLSKTVTFEIKPKQEEKPSLMLEPELKLKEIFKTFRFETSKLVEAPKVEIPKLVEVPKVEPAFVETPKLVEAPTLEQELYPKQLFWIKTKKPSLKEDVKETVSPIEKVKPKLEITPFIKAPKLEITSYVKVEAETKIEKLKIQIQEPSQFLKVEQKQNQKLSLTVPTLQAKKFRVPPLFKMPKTSVSDFGRLGKNIFGAWGKRQHAIPTEKQILKKLGFTFKSRRRNGGGRRRRH